MILETVFLDRTRNGDCLIYLIKAESFEGSHKPGEVPAHAVDKFHQEFKRETFGDKKQLELLIDLENFP